MHRAFASIVHENRKGRACGLGRSGNQFAGGGVIAVGFSAAVRGSASISSSLSIGQTPLFTIEELRSVNVDMALYPKGGVGASTQTIGVMQVGAGR